MVFDENRRLSFKEKEPDIQQEPDEPEMSKTDRASLILTDILSTGPRAVSDIQQIFDEEGISAKTAQRARKRIGASQDYRNGIAIWFFDGDM